MTLASVKDGAIVHFKNSVYEYMKVCSRDGMGGVVRLATGLYIPRNQLAYYGLEDEVTISADNLDALYFDED